MDISTEINKVFGTEMAKLFADQISEEELTQAAIRSWQHLQNRPWGNNLTEIENLTRIELMTRIKESIKNMLDEPQYMEEIDRRAKELVNKIREETERKIVENVSDRIAMLSCSYQGFGLSEMISSMINDAIRR